MISGHRNAPLQRRRRACEPPVPGDVNSSAPVGPRHGPTTTSSRRRWRHLDFGACQVWLEAHIHRVDEISYKRGHRYLTVVADHDTGRVGWVGKERTKETFEEFFDAVGHARTAQVEAISLDGSSIYLSVARDRMPQATICLDPLHVIKWTNEVVESVYRAQAPRFPLGADYPTDANGAAPATHCAPPANASTRTTAPSSLRCAALRRHRHRLWRTWELKEQLRDLYRTVDPADAPAYLKAWCTSALRSRIPAFTNLVGRIRKHFDAIIAAVQLGLSNSRLEGINAKIRLIQRRGHGIRDLDSLTSMIYLCLGGITINPPTGR